MFTSVAAALVGISGCGAVGPTDNPADPWRPVPMTPPDAFIAELDASCNRPVGGTGDPLSGMSVTAADVRGAQVGLLVYTSDAGAGAICWRGVGDVRPNTMGQWGAAPGRDADDLGATELCLAFNKGAPVALPGPDGAHAVAGQHGGDIASVVIEETVRGRVQATTVNGWFLAWWPGEEPGPTRFRVLGFDANGQPVRDLIAVRDAEHEDWPCSPG